MHIKHIINFSLQFLMQLGDVMKINLKDKKGFTSIDLSVAMIIILIFVVIMTSISYNVYLSSTEAKRTAVALNYAVDIFEHIGQVDFGDVAASYELLQIDSLDALVYKDISTSGNMDYISASIGTYDIKIQIEDYKGGGIVKIITLTITFPVSRKNTESLELQRVKVIDNGG